MNTPRGPFHLAELLLALLVEFLSLLFFFVLA
jgi:hypothetical protein